MSRLWLSGLAVSALCACSDGENGGRRQVPPDHPAWVTVVEDGRTRLAFGLPNSDEVALTLDCAPHGGHVVVSGPLAPGTSKLVLVADGARAEITGPARPDPETGLQMITGAVAARDAAFAAFVRTGRLARTDPSGTTALPASGPERGMVRAFLDHCAR
jgi:hypothetical protein